MKNLFFVCLISLFCNYSVKAQNNSETEISKYNLCLELGSNIIVRSASASLEVYLASSRSGKVNWFGRAGFGRSAVFYGPVGFGGRGALTMLTGRKDHHLELSGGIFMGNDTGIGMAEGFFALPLVDVGYRYQKPGKSFILRLKAGTLGAGVGLGYAF